MTTRYGRWAPPRQPTLTFPAVLTVRLAQVLTGVCLGHSNRRIADELGVTEDTVKTHMRRLLAVLGARDRAHAAALVCSGQVPVLVAPHKANLGRRTADTDHRSVSA